MSDPTQRKDATRNEDTGRDTYDLRCLNCGGYRGTWSAEYLPEPGICRRCRGGDLRTYWTRDWPKERTP